MAATAVHPPTQIWNSTLSFHQYGQQLLNLVALYVKIFLSTILAFFEDYKSKTTNYDNNRQLIEYPSTDAGRIEHKITNKSLTNRLLMNNYFEFVTRSRSTSFSCIQVFGFFLFLDMTNI